MGMMTIVRVLQPDLFDKIQELKAEQARSARADDGCRLLRRRHFWRRLGCDPSRRIGAGPAPPAAAQTGPITLADLEQRALQNNPTLRRRRQASTPPAGGPSRPASCRIRLSAIRGSEVSRGPVIRGGEHGFFVEQTIPLGGKLGLSRAVFEREVTEAEQIAESQRLRVVNTVRTVFYETLAAQDRVDVRDRLARLTAEAVGISQQLFNTGAADRPDVLEAEIEAQRERVALNAARNDLFRSWRRLAAIVGDPGLQPSRLAGTIGAPAPELDRDGVLNSLLAQSPEVKAARAPSSARRQPHARQARAGARSRASGRAALQPRAARSQRPARRLGKRI